AGRWVEEFWARGHSRGWYLLQTGLLHPYGHWFEAFATRGQLGVRGRGAGPPTRAPRGLAARRTGVLDVGADPATHRVAPCSTSRSTRSPRPITRGGGPSHESRP